MKKRLFSLLLCALLLAGCALNPLPGTTAPDTTPPASSVVPGTAAPTSPTVTEPAPTEPSSAAPTEPAPTEPAPTEPAPTAPAPTEPAPTEPPATQPGTPDKTFTVHFIDVGQADCALLSYGGKYILIDGGNVADSSLVVSYLLQQGVQELEAVICSHAHEDHVGGLAGVLAVFPTGLVMAPTKTYSSKCFDNFLKYTDQQGLEVTIPTPGDTLYLGAVKLTVLGPVKSYAETNNTSIVIMAEYGKTRFLFTGDMESEAENDMLDYWGESYDWRADVLKVGHHGSDTSSSYRLINAVMPTYGIISVGAGNTYGHPHELPLSRLKDAGVTVRRTDELGTVVATSDGKTVTLTWGKTSQQPDNPSGGEAQRYIGNKNSFKLHLPTCQYLPSPANQVEFSDYDEAIAAGYKPCSVCLG